ncbi:transglycosylase domain-containing protein [Agromyces humatus]|uniref:Transglycosylase domain-containing protein n=1 Tax=Agromyces humatus TaxID=279573 RepID=A0ABN2K8P9_9MICO|nr:transglycosylase domain-containing protein [Agromyces humatus]
MSDVGAGILGFVGMSALAGVLVTAAVTPALAVTGMAANNSITMFENLPGYLEPGELAQKSTIYAVKSDGNASPMASFYDENREEVALEYVSQYLKDAAIAGEDPRFYDHGGVDIAGTVRGALNTVVAGDTQGGSSITQQYVKNVLVNNDMAKAKTEEERIAAWEQHTETTVDRKLKEMRYAITLEKEVSKDEILQGYLNIAAFGGTVYGVQTAAQYYFQTNAKDITLPQAASLIAIVNNPEKFRLDYPESEKNGAATVIDGETVPYAANKDRRDYILGEMLREKKITQEEHDAAVATPVQPVITEPVTGCQAAPVYAFFCDYVTWEIKNKFDDPATEDVDEGAKMLKQGGLDIYTTIDMDLQNEATTALNENVPKTAEGIDIGGSVVSVEVATGRILAMAQNKDYSSDPTVLDTGNNYSAVNYNARHNYGGSSGFQPGSTFKVFTLGEWLNEGHSVNESVDSRKRSNWGTFNDSCNGPVNVDGWDPRNDGGEQGGYWSALQNTVNSYNTGFVAMAKQLDLCGIKKTATALMSDGRADGGELGTPSSEPSWTFQPSAVLGTEEVAPLAMATAFAAIAGKGVSCTPIAIDKITDAEGEPIAAPASECTQAVTAEVAAGMDYAMQRVMTSGTGSSSLYKMDTQGTPMIGKTGTTDNAEATWMSGASTRVATVVGVYNVTGHVNLRDTYFDAGEAAVLRHNIWPRVMDVANSKYPGESFPEPPQNLLFAPQVSVPDVLGLSPEAAQKALEDAGFGWTMDGDVDSAQPKGTIGAQNPSGTASRGAVISLQVSRGNGASVPDVTGQPADQAEAALTAAGFRVDRREEDTTDPAQVGVVISQSPGAGENAKRGDKVTITVGRLGAGNGNGDGGGPGDGNAPEEG